MNKYQIEKIEVFFRKFEELIDFIFKKTLIFLRNSKRLYSQGDKALYRTKNGDMFWLNPKSSVVDQSIINFGYFERESTEATIKLIKKGDVVIDIGANIGYYTVLLSRLVGEKGKVYAFEPTNAYKNILTLNIKENSLKNVQIIKVGLSDIKKRVSISVTESSATIHPTSENIINKELINLTTLDEFIERNKIKKVNS